MGAWVHAGVHVGGSPHASEAQEVDQPQHGGGAVTLCAVPLIGSRGQGWPMYRVRMHGEAERMHAGCSASLCLLVCVYMQLTQCVRLWFRLICPTSVDLTTRQIHHNHNRVRVHGTALRCVWLWFWFRLSYIRFDRGENQSQSQPDAMHAGCIACVAWVKTK